MSHGSRLRDGRLAVARCLALAFAVSSPVLGGAIATRAAEGPPGPWAPSPDVVVSEVVTGGAGASDEWVEIHDRGRLAADLGGLELVYVSASGGTVTRKATLQQLVLKPGTSLLLANEAGAFAGLADVTWSGGLAAAGGTVVLRVIGGDVVDSLSWGTAASAWLEGRPGGAPPAGASLERLPDGDDRNGLDTNDNRADTWVQSQPVPDARRVDPPATPAPTPQPTERPTPQPTERPTAAPTPQPTERPTPAPTPQPTEPPTPQPTERPTAAPTPQPTERPTPQPTERPTAAPTPQPTERPTSTPDRTAVPSVAPMPIAQVRDAALGTSVVVEGVLTTPLGLTDTGHGAFLQDASAGIALYLGSSTWPSVPSGHLVQAVGTVTSRYGQLTIALASAAGLGDLGPGVPPEPIPVSDQLPETLEGRLVSMSGTVSGSRDELSDGYAVDLDADGRSTRVVVASGTGIEPLTLSAGRPVTITGVLGQHASTAAGTNGYRIWPRTPADVVDRPMPSAPPTPSPSPTVTPRPTADARPTPSPAPTAMPAPTATATPRPTATAKPAPTPRPTATARVTPVVSIAAARSVAIGSRVAIEGTVMAVPGRILRAGVTFLADGTGGIAVSLPSGIDVSTIQPGVVIQLAGTIADPYANLELRASEPADLLILGRGGVPAPLTLTSSGLGEEREGRLAKVTGIIEGVETGSNGSLAVTMRDNGGEARVFAFGALGVTRDRLPAGARLTATGIVGQRESASGAGDGYRIWPRDPDDLVVVAATPTMRPGSTPTPRPGATGRPSPTSATAPTVRIATARDGQAVTIQGTITAPAGLLDGEGRRVTVQDSSGAILLRYPDGATMPPVGARVRATGAVGTWYGGLQLAADAAPLILGRTSAGPIVLRRAPGASDEWRLVRLTVHITDVARSGETWRAEASLGAGGSLPIVGLAGSRIPSTAMAEGRNATITGIVKRAYPTATDQRYALVPRSSADIDLGPDPLAAGTGKAGGTAGTVSANASLSPERGGDGSADDATTVDTTLAAIAKLDGRHVRVSGAVRGIASPLLTIDDGSASAQIRLLDPGATFEPPLTTGEVINVTGIVAERDLGGWEVVTRSDAVVRAATLALPTVTPLSAPMALTSSAVPSPVPLAVPIATTTNDTSRLVTAVIVAGLAVLIVGVVSGIAMRSARRRARPDASSRTTATTPQGSPVVRGDPDGPLDAS